MLYVTTRRKEDAYTAPQAFGQERGPDGGLFVPLRMPRYTPKQIDTLLRMGFSESAAAILNLFYPARLTAQDVEAAIGIRPATLTAMSHRIIIAEMWRDPEKGLPQMAGALLRRIRGSEEVTDWARVVVRLAVLFGAFSLVKEKGIDIWKEPLDISVSSEDFSAPMSAWYARAMGLPVGNILCACNDNSNVWDLFHYGQLHTNAVATATSTPDGDVAVPTDLERLVFETQGREEARRYCEVCRRGKVYQPPESGMEGLRRGFFAAVVSQDRMENIIRSVYRGHGYVLGPYSALAYGALQDYRAAAGEGRLALLFAERGQLLDGETTARAMGMEARELSELLRAR